MSAGTPAAAALRLALLGDSIAWGQGASRPEERLGPRLETGLRGRGAHFEHRVFAVPGARSSELHAQVAAATDGVRDSSSS